MTGFVDTSKIKEAGKLLGADAAVFVELSHVNFTTDSKSFGNSERVSELLVTSITARIVTIDTGEIFTSASTSDQYKNSFTKLGEMVKTGSSMDKLDFVKKSLSKAASNLCEDLAKQIKK